MDAVLLPSGTINLNPPDTSDIPSGGTSVDTMVVGAAQEDADAAPASAAIIGAASGGTAHDFSGDSSGSATQHSGSDDRGGLSAGIGGSTLPAGDAILLLGFDAPAPGDTVTAAGLASGGIEYAVSDGGTGVTAPGAAGATAGPGIGGFDTVTSAVVSGATPGGLTFNISFDASVSGAPIGFDAGVIAAFQFYANTFNDPGVTLFFNVGYGEVNGTSLGANALGQSLTFFGPGQTYTALRSQMIADAKTAADAAAIANDLPVADPTGGKLLEMSVAEEKALGFTGLGTPGSSFANPDGDIGFSSTFTFHYDPNTAVQPGEFDFIGVVEHEISEVMGRFSALNLAGDYSPLDLLRYAGSSIRQLTTGDPSYFSLDAGKTDLYNFNNFTTGNSGDLGDWAGTTPYTPDSFNDNSNSGVTNPVTPRDATLMDVLGWDRVSATSHTVSTGETSSGVIIYSGDQQTVLGGGIASATYILSGGVEVISATGSAAGATVNSGGQQDVFGSASATVVNGGRQIVESGGTTINPVLNGIGGVLDLVSGAIVSGGISFGSSGAQLRIHGSAMPTNTISGFTSGDTFDLANVAFDSTGHASLVNSGSVHNQLHITEGGNTYDLNLDPADSFSGDFFHLVSDGSGGTLVTEDSLLATTRIFDVMPVASSTETDQNSEPSLAVNPTDPTQIIAGSFTSSFPAGGGVVTPFFLTTDGGATWSTYDQTIATGDKTLAWKADGSGFLAATLAPTPGVADSFDIKTYSGTVAGSGFGSPIDTFAPANPDFLDQPWIRTGPSNHVYVAYNDLNNFGTGAGRGMTASINVSINGGTTFTPAVIEHVAAAAGQDAPSVRLAVGGSTVYAVFTRWNATIENDANGERFASDVVVVRSDNAGADSFTALGSGGAGTVVATPTGLFANAENTPLTLGQQRISSDVAIAVDPGNTSHLLVAYHDAPGANGSGQLQLIVSESSNAGATWTTKFTTPSSTRSAQPGLAILADGTIGFLYNNYDPATNKLSQHMVQTADDFATTSDSVLATESNAIPVSTFDPYLGDFFDLQGFGSTFYGIFSASNADNGTDAQFANITFQRHFTGTPGTATFQLEDGSFNPVAASIDPFFFTASDIAVACFCRGTLILTDQGEVPVEELAIGDAVMTISGEPRPVKWIGRRCYDGRFVAANRSVLPICVKAGAIADDLPARDLWVSPEHALFLDGMLVPARQLVNGSSVVQAETAEQVDYFHVELDAHDVIFAEGMPAESYVDCDNRGMFQNAGEFLRLYLEGARLPSQFCAARLEGAAAEVLELREALLRRVEALGRLTGNPDLHLIVDGETVRPLRVENWVYRFRIPTDSGAVWLRSRSVVPAELEAAGMDRRRLGVPVKRIVLRQVGLRTVIGHSHGSLREGFHADESQHRWTDGIARLPEESLRPFAGDVTLEVHLAESGLRYSADTPAPIPAVLARSTTERTAQSES